ncbi:MAG: T9SS type A sorting domain-containing protein [bacterium]
MIRNRKIFIRACASVILLFLSSYFFNILAVDVNPNGDYYIINNGKISVKVPSGYSGTEIPAPIEAISPNDGNWYGQGSWETNMILDSFAATPIANGVHLYYRFQSECWIDTPYAEITITTSDNRDDVSIQDRYRMSEGSKYVFNASYNWVPDDITVKAFNWMHDALGSAVGRGDYTLPITQRDRFSPTLTPYNLFYLQPRWTQGVDAGYFTAVETENFAIALGACQAGEWYFPHDNYIWARAGQSQGDLYFDFPTQRGGRFYLMAIGDSNLFKNANSIIDDYQRYSGGRKFYDDNNPSGTLRSISKNWFKKVDGGDTSSCPIDDIFAYLHPDFYGYPFYQWSPINPNFYTDLVRIPAMMACGCADEPLFDSIKTVLEDRLRRHLEISWTMPGGAGECPGYNIYGYELVEEFAAPLKTYTGIDMMSWDIMIAAGNFIEETGRNPQGDTHPPDKYVGNLSHSKEYPNYGIVFVSENDTLNWKAGPMRGHYHGDQLSFHWWGKAVDHMVSYSPRADQEHMHNRVSFKPTNWDYANMDGFERVIAFDTSLIADVGIAQVESNRLRKQPELPESYVWQGNWDEIALDTPLVYRRTIVKVKSATNYYVIRDQYTGSYVDARFNIHTYGSKVDWDGTNNIADFGNMSLYFAKPASVAFERFDYTGYKDPTKGAKFKITGSEGEFITVMWPNSSIPTCSSLENGVQVGSDIIIFDDEGTNAITVNSQVVLLNTQINLNRSQGYGYLDLGRPKWDGRFFVPSVGYNMGQVPHWIYEQRVPEYIPETECPDTSTNSDDISINPESNETINIYPTVTYGIVHISSEEELLNAGINIYNSAGKNVYYENVLNMKEKIINLEGLNPGVYVLSVFSEKGAFSKKIILK